MAQIIDLTLEQFERSCQLTQHFCGDACLNYALSNAFAKYHISRTLQICTKIEHAQDMRELKHDDK